MTILKDELKLNSIKLNCKIKFAFIYMLEFNYI